MPDYFGSGRRLYIDKLIDWETYFQLRDGHHADLEAEVGAYNTILETTATLAESFQADAREHWAEEARLTDDGGAESPPHILAAYEKWGRACPEHLDGDFSFVLYDGRERELFCVQSIFPPLPLCTVRRPDRFVFGGYLPYPFFMGYAASWARERSGAEVHFRDSIALRESLPRYFRFLEEERFNLVFIESATPSTFCCRSVR